MSDFVIKNGVLVKYTGPEEIVTIPASVACIGDSAFLFRENLASVTIPDSVTSIGKSAFYGCRSLTSITIPASATSIGAVAFVGCSSLMSVTISDGVTSIGDGAFSWCSSLTSVTIPGSVTSIGKDVFRECSSLTSVTILDGVTSIGEGAFRKCSSLKSVTIPDSVTSIGDSAFEDCCSLTSVTIPGSVIELGKRAFRGCTALTEIVLPASVAEIANDVFANCTVLTRITTAVKLTKKHFGKNLPSAPIVTNDLTMLPNEMKPLAAVGYALEPETADTPRSKVHIKYIKGAVANLVDLAIQYPPLLTIMCANRLIKPELVEVYLSEAEKANNVVVNAMLLDYQQNKATDRKETQPEKDEFDLESDVISDFVRHALIKKPNAQAKTELLEEIALHGTLEDLHHFSETCKEAEFTARALGYAVRYRDADFVQAMAAQGCNFNYIGTAAFSKKYQCSIKVSNKYSYMANYALLALDANVLMAPIKVPEGIQTAPMAERCRSLQMLAAQEAELTCLQNLLYHAILENEQPIVDALISGGIRTLNRYDAGTAFATYLQSMDSSAMHERNFFFRKVFHFNRDKATAAILHNLGAVRAGRQIYFSGPELSSIGVMDALGRTDVFDLVMDGTIDLAKATKKDIILSLVKNNNTEGLAYAIEHKLVADKRAIKRLCDKDGTSTDAIAGWLND